MTLFVTMVGLDPPIFFLPLSVFTSIHPLYCCDSILICRGSGWHIRKPSGSLNVLVSLNDVRPAQALALESNTARDARLCSTALLVLHTCLASAFYPHCHRIDAFPFTVKTRPSSHQPIKPGLPNFDGRRTASRRLQPHKGSRRSQPSHSQTWFGIPSPCWKYLGV